MILNNSQITVIELVGMILAAVGVILSFISLLLVYIIFARNQKNFYKKFLKFLEKKRKILTQYAKTSKLNEDEIINYLIEDLRFFTEDFLINFTNDGTLKYLQYQMLLTMYKHIRKRFLITRKLTKKAINHGYKYIDIRVQLFGKYNNLNDKYFDLKLKNAKYKKDNLNIYASRIFVYNHKNRTFELEPRKTPILYLMGTDTDFKKNIFYIFSSANKIDKTLEGADLEKSYFFIACSYTDKKEKYNKKEDDKILARREKIQEKTK